MHCIAIKINSTQLFPWINKVNNYTDYSKERFDFIADALPYFDTLYQQYLKADNPLRQPIATHALDDAGTICAVMIKTLQAG